MYPIFNPAHSLKKYKTEFLFKSQRFVTKLRTLINKNSKAEIVAQMRCVMLTDFSFTC